MKLVTANIKSNPLMTQKHVLHDMAQVKALGSVILWQEIAPHRYKVGLKEELSAVHNWHHVNLDLEVPITYNGDFWHLIDAGSKLTHKGRKHVTPNRYVSWAALERTHSSWPPVVFMNTHMISGAFSNHYPLTKKWRQQMWHEHFKVQQAMIKKFNTAGHTVVCGGDFNRTDLPKFTSNQRLLSKGSIDHLFVCENASSVQVSLHQVGTDSHVYTDHDPRWAELYFSHPVD